VIFEINDTIEESKCTADVKNHFKLLKLSEQLKTTQKELD